MMMSARATSIVLTINVFLMTVMTAVPVTLAGFPRSSVKTAKGCPDPISPKRGVYRLGADKLWVEYICQPGHTLIGKNNAVCNNGIWSEQSPVCVGRDCEIPLIRDASIISLYGGGLIRIECRSGYSLRNGTGILACIDGQWNATGSRCTNKKKEILSAKSSMVAADNQVGKQLKSESREKQQSSGKRSHKEWLEDSDYSCSRQDFTIYPPSVPNARAFTRWAMYDGLPRLYTTYQCKWGFKPSTGGAKNVYCQNGEWVGATPKCQTVVTEEPRQRDFSGVASALSHEELLLYADYTCLDGSSFDGNTIDPPVLTNARNNALRFVILEGRPRLYIEYMCTDGFELENTKHAHLYCKGKRWIGERPNCVPASKSKNSCTVNNGGCSQICSKGELGQISCSCKQGYDLESDKTSCTDVDECEVNNGGCDHLCDNSDGSFECRCFPGYVLHPNRKVCSAIDT